MATTSIWAVKGWLGAVVVYVDDPGKTTNPASYEKPNYSKHENEALADVIEYASGSEKTAMKKFVSGVNCIPDTARAEMIRTKRLFKDQSGRIAFHGYQSFAPGEATPMVAHEIGVALAQEVWGKSFQVLVATHLDKENHIYSHFVVNSTSFVDGHHYHNSKADYRKMRDISDRLCHERGLSVIENPQPGKSKHYAEWSAEKKGRPTWRSVIKSDIDRFIAESTSEKSFFKTLMANGYEYKIGKDISVRPPGKERFVRLVRNFGDTYTIESIRYKIISREFPLKPLPISKAGKKGRARVRRNPRARHVGGLRGLYIKYQYKLGAFKGRGSAQNRRMHFLLREDIVYLDRIIEGYRFLSRENISTSEQLNSFLKDNANKISSLTEMRRKLYNENRKVGTANSIREKNKDLIREISNELNTRRRCQKTANDVEDRSAIIKGKLDTIKSQQHNIKENKNHGRTQADHRTGDKNYFRRHEDRA